MRIKIGDSIKADLGRGGLFAIGRVERMEGRSIFVRLQRGDGTDGALQECPAKGDHKVNGLPAVVPPEGAYRKLLALDKVDNLTEWEREFVGDLVQRGQRHFSPKQEQMIEKIYGWRIGDA